MCLQLVLEVDIDGAQHSMTMPSYINGMSLDSLHKSKKQQKTEMGLPWNVAQWLVLGGQDCACNEVTKECQGLRELIFAVCHAANGSFIHQVPRMIPVHIKECWDYIWKGSEEPDGGKPRKQYC